MSVAASPVDEATGATTGALLTGCHGLAHLMAVSLRSVSRANSAGKIPRPVRIGGSVRWRVAEIHAWIDCGCPDRKAWEGHPANKWKTPRRS